MSLSQTATLINTKVDAAVAANERGDFAAALTFLRSAKMLLATIPDTQGQHNAVRWDRAAIDSMIADLSRQRSSAGGVRYTKVRYTGADDDCD